MRHIKALFIKIHETALARGSSYIPTPAPYNHNKCGLINIQNDDQQCFMWRMKYHQSQQVKHDDRITKLRQVNDKYNYDGISYPTTFEDIKHIENTNGLAIFV